MEAKGMLKNVSKDSMQSNPKSGVKFKPRVVSEYPETVNRSLMQTKENAEQKRACYYHQGTNIKYSSR